MKSKLQRLQERYDKLNAEANNLIDQRDALQAELAKAKDELTTLVAWIAGDGPDALTVLQRLYLSGDEPTLNRIRAAQAAIGFERPKPAATTINLSFYDRVRRARLEADAKLLEQAPKTIEHQPESPLPESA